MLNLGDRMKENYENRARYYLTRRTPVVIRIDGRAFHTYTRGLEKPFCAGLMRAMQYAAVKTAEEIQGFKVAYVQSDEASFVLADYDDLGTQAWFDYNKSKVETISASVFTAHFNVAMAPEWKHRQIKFRPAYFDSRAFNIPPEEVANYLLWRAKDWERNSVAMYCGAFYTHKEMHGKSRYDQHEMLFAKGKNWVNDLPEVCRNGTFLWGGFGTSNVTLDVSTIAKYIAIAPGVDLRLNLKQPDALSVTECGHARG